MSIRVHSVQTGTVLIRPNQRHGKGAGVTRLINTFIDRRWTEPLPIYAWVIEHPEGVIVIDTGETSDATVPGYFPAWHPYFKNVSMQVNREQEIGFQLRALGYREEDIRWVILTHLHTDHAGGLRHFPKSEILVMRRAFEAAIGVMGQMRGFLPHRLPTWFAPKLIDLVPDPFAVFPGSFAVTGANDVLIVPTFGHTDAHVSVILQDSDLTYFFAGDASYTQQLMVNQQIDGVTLDSQLALQTLQRICQFVQSTPTIYLPTHDPESAKRLVNKNTVRSENK